MGQGWGSIHVSRTSCNGAESVHTPVIKVYMVISNSTAMLSLSSLQIIHFQFNECNYSVKSILQKQLDMVLNNTFIELKMYDL